MRPDPNPGQSLIQRATRWLALGLIPITLSVVPPAWLPAARPPAAAGAQLGATPTRAAPSEPVVPAATRTAVPVPPRPGQPTWTPTPNPTAPPKTGRTTATPTGTPTPGLPLPAAGDPAGQPPTRPGGGATPAASAEPGTVMEPPAATPGVMPTVHPATLVSPTHVVVPDPALARVPARFGYGVNVIVPDTGRLARAREAGFEWIKLILPWSDSEPQPGVYQWDTAPDSFAENFARAAEAAGLKLVLRVDHTPDWANGNRGPKTPPDDPETYGRFMRALAERLRGRVVAYELWNEPNLAWEWGDRDPDPAAFTRLLNAGYAGVKAGDPDALVISGALVATGWTKAGIAMDDLDFLRGLAAAGARFDALGVHPYGFAAPPEGWHANGILQFRRAEAWRVVMEAVGWGDRPMWATEFNWLVDPSAEGVECAWPDRDWQRVPPEWQAAYLQRAFTFARERWPWMGPMFIFNLDMAMAPTGWSDPCEQMRWYSLLRPDGTPRPAFDAVRRMPKPARGG